MTVAATTARGKVKEALKTLVSESSTFQTAVGAENAAAALASIHIGCIDDPSTEAAYALIVNSGNDKNDADSTNAGGSRQFLKGGDVELWLYRPIAEDYQDEHGDALIDFENFYEAVLDEIMELAGTPGYLVINNWSLIDQPARNEPESKEKDMYQARIMISWGLI